MHRTFLFLNVFLFNIYTIGPIALGRSFTCFIVISTKGTQNTVLPLQITSSSWIFLARNKLSFGNKWHNRELGINQVLLNKSTEVWRYIILMEWYFLLSRCWSPLCNGNFYFPQKSNIINPVDNLTSYEIVSGLIPFHPQKACWLSLTEECYSCRFYSGT